MIKIIKPGKYNVVTCPMCKCEFLYEDEDIKWGTQRDPYKTLFEFLKEKYDNREDKDNMYGVGISDAEFRSFIFDYILGEDWYVVDPISQTQINEIALHEILEKCSKRYRKERKLYHKLQKVRKNNE